MVTRRARRAGRSTSPRRSRATTCSPCPVLDERRQDARHRHRRRRDRRDHARRAREETAALHRAAPLAHDRRRRRGLTDEPSATAPALADAIAAAHRGRARAGIHHGVGRQRRRRHRQPIPQPARSSATACCGARAAGGRADRRAGDGDAHGRVTGKGLAGADSREVRRSDLRSSRWPRCSSSTRCSPRPSSPASPPASEIFHLSRYIAVPLAIDRRLLLRAAVRQQDRRAHVRRLLADLSHLYRFGAARASGLARGRARHARADVLTGRPRLARRR